MIFGVVHEMWHETREKRETATSDRQGTDDVKKKKKFTIMVEKKMKN